MEYKFTILGRLDALNEYTSANRQNPYVGGEMKRDNENTIIWAIRQQLSGVHISKSVIIHYTFYEKNKRRDKDNILSAAMKFIQDSLVKCGVLKNDGWSEIENFTHNFLVDKNNPRIEIILEEVGD
jgi:Holliday junction resolvase RusA-like endonuclease